MNDISVPILTPQTAVFDFINGIENGVYKITNDILLIVKLHIWKSREKSILELSRLINKIKKLLEKQSAQSHVRKLEQYNIKWEKTYRRIKILKWKFIDVLLKTKDCLHLGVLGKNSNICGENFSVAFSLFYLT